MQNGLNITHIKSHISPERTLTFTAQYSNHLSDEENEMVLANIKAYQLYLWNTKMSGALLPIVGFYEVILRNAIMKVIDYVYYPHSILDNRFISSLNTPVAENLINEINSLLSDLQEPYSLVDSKTGKRKKSLNIGGISKGTVVAKLSFSFWEHLLTQRYRSIWQHHYKKAFPYMTSSELIKDVHIITESIRILRNRICHNEPIFKYNIEQLFRDVEKVLKYIDPLLLNVLQEIAEYSSILKQQRIEQGF